jgi:disulfide bond formation protein DsbB
LVEPDDVALFLGLLAVAGQLFVLAVVVLAVGARWSDACAAGLDAGRREVGPYALGLAWAVAGVATLGSLYFSEVAHFRPCVLCWVQRTSMYPLAVILGVAWWRRDADVRWYALPLAGLGLAVSAYHVLLERVPSLESGSCDPAAPCTTRWVEPLGYLTIPTMAGTGFALVIALLLLAPRAEELT